MNELIALYQSLKRELPETVSLKVDAPDKKCQAGWLDIEFEGRWIAVEWKPGIGFGVSLLDGMEEDPSRGLFEGPDQLFRKRSEAQEHILSLLHVSEVETRLRRVARA